MEVTTIGGDQEEPAVPRGTPHGLVQAGAGIPDLRWVNRHLAIEEVARKLNLRFGEQRMLHCWRPERHQHGDRTPVG